MNYYKSRGGPALPAPQGDLPLWPDGVAQQCNVSSLCESLYGAAKHSGDSIAFRWQSYKKLQKATKCYKKLQKATKSYKNLQKATKSYKSYRIL